MGVRVWVERALVDSSLASMQVTTPMAPDSFVFALALSLLLSVCECECGRFV